MDGVKDTAGGHIMEKRPFPASTPLRNHLREITHFIFDGSGIKDRELILYISDMLADFALVDNLYRFRDNRGKKLNYLVDMLLLIETLPVGKEREARRHMGDFCLFIAGIFPESINRGGRRSFSPSLYINEGKKSYRMVSEMGYKTGEGAFFNKLAHKFDSCIHALGLEKEYLFDPFYQYLMKQLGRFLKHRSAISTIAELNFLSHARISS